MFKLIIKSILCGAFCHVGSVIVKDILQVAKDPYDRAVVKSKWENFKNKFKRK